MHILKAIWQAVSTTEGSCGSKKTNIELGNQKTESSSLLPQSEAEASLTSEFTDFSHSWNALRLCLFHALFYYSAAVVGFTLIEHFSIVDSLYVATVIFTTIGFGDLVPKSQSGQWFTLLLAGYGIVILGIFLGIAGAYVVETHNKVAAEQERERNKKVFGSIQKKGEPVSAEYGASQSSCETEKKKKSLVHDIIKLVLRETPTVFTVAVIAIIIGMVENWTISDR